MSNCIFVSGTDTAIGKTFCSAAIAVKLEQMGYSVAYFKPVECGATHSDKNYVGQYVKNVFDLYKFKAAISPHLASGLEGVEISIEAIKNKIAELSASFDFVVIEGAGGLLVPISDNYDYAKLALELEMSIILVVGSRLGVLNHARLNFEFAKANKLKLMGYIFNEIISSAKAGEQIEAIQTNRVALRKIAQGYGISELFALPFFDDMPEAKTLLAFMDNDSFSAKIRHKF